jgi:hypothetical protein
VKERRGKEDGEILSYLFVKLQLDRRSKFWCSITQ